METKSNESRKSMAAVLQEFDKPLALREIPIPTVKPNSLLVRVKAAGICGTDIGIWHGRLPIKLPIILGHEGAGIIEELGSEVLTDNAGNKVKKGDKIAWAAPISCGKCYYCLTNQPTKCIARKVYGINLSPEEFPYLVGSYSEYVYLLPGISFFKIPDMLSIEEEISFACAGPTVINAFERMGGVSVGETVVILGAGPVGLFSAIMAQESGAKNVIVMQRSKKRLELARKMGATITIDNSNSKEANAEIFALTNSIGADVVIDCTGSPTAFEQSISLLRSGGKLLEIGQYTDKGQVLINPHQIVNKQLHIIGSWGLEPKHLWKYIKYAESFKQKYDLASVVTKFTLKQVHEAFKCCENRETIKAVLTP